MIHRVAEWFMPPIENDPRKFIALAVKYSSKLDIIGYTKFRLRSLRVKIYFYPLTL